MDAVPPLPLAVAAAAAAAQRPAAVELAVKARKAAIAKTLGPKGLRHKWLRLDAEGDTLVLTTNKSSLTARLGVQARDLRLLDAAPASSPPAVLARDKAIIVNLEFIKCIITTDHALILDSGEPRLLAFVEEMRRRLRGTDVSGSVFSFGDEKLGASSNSDRMPASGVPFSTSAAAAAAGLNALVADEERGLMLEKAFAPSDAGSDGSHSRQESPRFAPRIAGRLELTDIAEEMPFEMRVLEAALDFVTAYMEHLTSDLESAAHPALDAIISKLTERRLDRLRTIKSRMVRLNTRVETIRELLEKVLDDDDDMRDMNLAARVRQEERQSMWRLSSGPGGGGDEAPELFDKEEEEERDKDQVEQLLETYFMNLDNTWNRLQTLAEYVDDTEDYIKFDIDTKRNQFIEYRLLLIIVTFGVTMYSNVFNVFGMNLGINARWRLRHSVFNEVVWVSLAGSVAFVAAMLLWARQKKLLLY